MATYECKGLKRITNLFVIIDPLFFSFITRILIDKLSKRPSTFKFSKIALKIGMILNLETSKPLFFFFLPNSQVEMWTNESNNFLSRNKTRPLIGAVEADAIAIHSRPGRRPQDTFIRAKRLRGPTKIHADALIYIVVAAHMATKPGM